MPAGSGTAAARFDQSCGVTCGSGGTEAEVARQQVEVGQVHDAVVVEVARVPELAALAEVRREAVEVGQIYGAVEIGVARLTVATMTLVLSTDSPRKVAGKLPKIAMASTKPTAYPALADAGAADAVDAVPAPGVVAGDDIAAERTDRGSSPVINKETPRLRST